MGGGGGGVKGLLMGGGGEIDGSVFSWLRIIFYNSPPYEGFRFVQRFAPWLPLRLNNDKDFCFTDMITVAECK